MERIIIIEDSGNEEVIASFLAKMKGKVKLDSDFDKLVGKSFSFGDISQVGKRNKRIAVNFAGSISLLQPDQVIKIETLDNGTIISMFDGSKINACDSLESLTLKIKQRSFIRIHEQLLINLDFVEKIHFGETMILHLNCGSSVPVNEPLQDIILEYFEKFTQ